MSFVAFLSLWWWFDRSDRLVAGSPMGLQYESQEGNVAVGSIQWMIVGWRNHKLPK